MKPKIETRYYAGVVYVTFVSAGLLFFSIGVAFWMNYILFASIPNQAKGLVSGLFLGLGIASFLTALVLQNIRSRLTEELMRSSENPFQDIDPPLAPHPAIYEFRQFGDSHSMTIKREEK